MTETQATINQWEKEAFPECTANAAIDHLKEEFQEFLDAPNPEKQAIEAADMMILLYAWAGYVNIDLQAHIDAKMKINRNRKWKIMPDGSGRHL